MWDGGGHRYQLEKVVGNGAFGIVWRARNEDNEVVAIKKVMIDRRYHNRELQMMKVMEHENVVRLRHYFEKAGRKKDETFLYLVMDYLPETIRSVALKHHKRAKRFHVDHIRAYLYQTFKALEYIHARRICHRDIKPDNLLCDPNSLKCRLCDFGCSQFEEADAGMNTRVGTRLYMPPELLLKKRDRKYDHACDLWSLGVMSYVLLCGCPPFPDENEAELNAAIRTAKFDWPPWTDARASAKGFVRELLQVDPTRRPSADAALRHEWIVQSAARAPQCERRNSSQRDEVAMQASLGEVSVRMRRFTGMARLKKIALNTLARDPRPGKGRITKIVPRDRDAPCTDGFYWWPRGAGRATAGKPPPTLTTTVEGAPVVVVVPNEMARS